MKNIKIQIWQTIPTVLIAFIAGYFFNWLTKDHSIEDANLAFWLGACSTILAIVGAFVLGERQIHMFWSSSVDAREQYADKKRTAFLAMATAAFHAIERLDGHYRNTHHDRMRIRAVYHGDTFSSLIEALTAIPLHELDSADAAIALAGLRKNMVEAHHAIDLFIAGRNRAEGVDVLFPDAFLPLDLRGCKTHAEAHYRTLEQVLRQ